MCLRQRFRSLAFLVVPAFLLAGCLQPDPNKNKNLGPNVQLVLFAIKGTSGPTNVNSKIGREYVLNMTDASAASLNPFVSWETQNSNPVYDWIMLIVPGDNSGIEAFAVEVTFWGACNEQAGPYSTPIGSVDQGSPGGHVLPASQLGYSLELSNTLAQSLPCQIPNGNPLPGAASGVWQIQGKATNGRGLSSPYNAFIQVGNAPLPNFGPQ